MLCAAVNRADGDDNRIKRIVFAARNRLPGVNHLRRKHDRVLGNVGVRAMPAYAAHGHIH